MGSTLPLSGRLYVGCVVAAGTAILLYALGDLYVHPVDYRWLIIAGLTLVSGSFTVKVPGISSSISVSETFVIITVLLFGISPATITVALEGLIISLWLLRNTREVYRVFFNMAAGAISVWVASHVFFLLDVRPLSEQVTGVGQLLGPLFLLAIAYYLVNSWLIAFAVGLETGTSPLYVWRANYTWLSLNYLGGPQLQRYCFHTLGSLAWPHFGSQCHSSLKFGSAPVVAYADFFSFFSSALSAPRSNGSCA